MWIIFNKRLLNTNLVTEFIEGGGIDNWKIEAYVADDYKISEEQFNNKPTRDERFLELRIQLCGKNKEPNK